MTAFDPRVAQELVARFVLKDLRLLAIRHELVGDEPEASDGVRLQLAVETKASAEQAQLRFVSDLRVHALDADGRPYLACEQRFLTDYVANGPVPSASELEVFAQSQLLVHLWPNARVQLQVGSGLLGVRPLLLPSLRVTQHGARLEVPGAAGMPLVPSVRVDGG